MTTNPRLLLSSIRSDRTNFRQRLIFATASVVLLFAACNNKIPPTGTAPRTGAILTFTQDEYAAQVPKLAVDKTPSHVCGSNAPFLTELATTATSVAVNYEWAPLVPGPVPSLPTVSEPTFLVSGKITKWYPPNKDLRFSHPFGLDYSMNMDMNPDSLFALNLTGQSLPFMHAEIESGLFPYDALGWAVPRVGDSVALKGDWIVDCGHPGMPPQLSKDPDVEGYGSEIHPPTFLAFARASHRRNSDTWATDSLALGNPYRPTQLYNGANESLTDNFSNANRFTDSNTGPFPKSLDKELHDFWSPNIGLHQLIEPTDLGVVTWDVCAASPKPPGARFAYGYRFTERTGIGLQAIAKPETGCLEFIAAQGPSYTPAIPSRASVPWSWTDINTDFKDIKDPATGLPFPKTIQQMVHDKICAMWCAWPPLGKSSNDPFVDAYSSLHPTPPRPPCRPPGVQQSCPTPPQTPPSLTDRIITAGADDQPFPFFGLVHVEWTGGQAG
jgi:hypothetical protein